MLHYQIWTGNEEEKRGGGEKVEKNCFRFARGRGKTGKKGWERGDGKTGNGGE